MIKSIIHGIAFLFTLFMGYVWITSSIEEQEKSTRPYTKDEWEDMSKKQRLDVLQARHNYGIHAWKKYTKT